MNDQDSPLLSVEVLNWNGRRVRIIVYGLCRVRPRGFRNDDIPSARGKLEFPMDDLRFVEVNQIFEMR